MNFKISKLFAILVCASLASQTVSAYHPYRYDDEYDAWEDTEDAYDYDDGSAAGRGLLGGAATGALIGGLAGGGRGAAIGAGVGAGTGLLTGASIDEQRRQDRIDRARARAQERYNDRFDTRTQQRERRRAEHAERISKQPRYESEEYY